MAKKILLVDDSKFIRNVMKTPIVKAGYEVSDAASPAEALQTLDGFKPDLVLTDLKMPAVIDGLKFLHDLKEIDPEVPVVVFTADTDIDRESSILRTGVRDILKKPLPPNKLLLHIRKVIGAPEEGG